LSLRKDPWRNSRFKLEIGSVIKAQFSEITVPDSSTDVIEYREGDDLHTNTRKIPGLTKYSNVVLKRGTTDNKQINDWYQKVVEGRIREARTDFAIILLDELGIEAARWDFNGGWPTKYDPSDLNAKGNDIAIETLEIAHEGMVRSK
jgi:phage tail-like protein